MNWEYTTLTIEVEGGLFLGGGKPEKVDERLNSLGAKGWELVSVMDTNRAGGATRLMVYTFKRPKA